MKTNLLAPAGATRRDVMLGGIAATLAAACLELPCRRDWTTPTPAKEHER